MRTHLKSIGGIVLGLLLLCGVRNANAQTTPQIAQNAFGSTVLLVIEGAKGRSQGSGFVVRDGLIATNYHVIEGIKRGKAKRVGAAREYAIEAIYAVDKVRDLAIVKSQVLTRRHSLWVTVMWFRSASRFTLRVTHEDWKVRSQKAS